MFKAGFLINPIAGCGQFYNMKGSDSLTPEMCQRSISIEKAVEFLSEVLDLEVEYLTSSGRMGEDAFKKIGLKNYRLVYEYSGDSDSSDTKAFVTALADMDVNILLFFGGDGTARDIIDAGYRGKVIGVPLGTKMFSSVFAISVSRAAQLFREIAGGKPTDFITAEVIDLNEAAYVAGKMDLSVYGSMNIPVSDYVMSVSKAEYPESSIESVAEYIVEKMEKGVSYLIGPGSTCKSVSQLLNLESDLLGFDLIRNGSLVKKDLSEQEIFETAENPTVLILSPIGGQGFLIGRGNKQLSGRVISRIGFENIIIVAAEEKLRDLKALYIDVNNLKVPKPKFLKVLFSYGRFKLMPVIF